MLALSRHQVLILLHILGGIAAIAVGLLQFVSALRSTSPRVHRVVGYLYLSSVFLAGGTVLWLSSDTPIFAADGLNDLASIDLSVLGLSPSFLGYRAFSKFCESIFSREGRIHDPGPSLVVDERPCVSPRSSAPF